MEQQLHRACEPTKSKQQQNHACHWPSVTFFILPHKQYNGIIKGWLHSLASESKGRILVNNILMFGSAWCLIMAQIQFSLIKKKIGPPEHSLTPHSPTSNNISFFLYPPCQSGRHMCITPYNNFQKKRKKCCMW